MGIVKQSDVTNTYLRNLVHTAFHSMAFRKKIHIRLDDDLHRRVRTYVAQRGTTIQNFIVELLEKALSGSSKPEEKTPEQPAA
jgi:predicted DNA binding CopG/RHH family protein